MTFTPQINLYTMKNKRFLKGFRMILAGSLLSFISMNVYASEAEIHSDVLEGKQYFEGSKRFKNGGVSCISCHSVNNSQVAKGGLLAKDLTDVYSRLGEGISTWLMAPPFPAMAVSYQNNVLTENERVKLQAFFKYANENHIESPKEASMGYGFMLIGGDGGLAVILISINIIWHQRKRKMVKREIFDRQIYARDAKF